MKSGAKNIRLKTEGRAKLLCARAYQILEIDPAAVRQAPRIEPLLRPIGGRSGALRYLEGSEEPEAREVLRLARKLTVHLRAAVPLEAYCVALNLSPKKLFSVVVAEVMEQNGQIAALLAKTHHPAVLATSIKLAKKPAGVKDREMIHKAMGFLPTPKNSVTVVHGNQHIDHRRSAQVAVLPPLEDVARTLATRFLEAAPPPAEDGEED